MLFKSIATVLTVAGLAAAQAKELTHGQADIKMNNIDATFTFDKVATGMNITVTVNAGLTSTIQKLPVGFEYHIHVNPVGPNNDCMATGLHLDPAKVGVSKPCDPANLTSCQTGDLSGKYGNLIGSDSGAIPTKQYIDTQLTFTGVGENAMVGRSVVIHNNVTRIACANLVVDGYVAPTPSAGANGTTTPSGTGSPSTSTNGAAKLIGSVALSGVVAMMMLAL
ncbi:hypothetical protein BGX28_008376 [Mortierella sp. GBA30]|nr:hypothetical protein BGX28_008376 [Mortierella sp. GBA30]